MNADFCTDGNWCYIVLWTIPQPSSWRVDWESLKTRLQSACPSCLMSFYFNQQSNGSRTSTWYMLKMFCVDRKGLLHGEYKFGYLLFLFVLWNPWRWFNRFMPCGRCYEGTLSAGAHNSESESDDNPRWQSSGSLLHYRQHVSLSIWKIVWL